MTNRRLSVLVSFAAMAMMAVVIGGCGESFPECSSDDKCQEYNSDEGSDGYNRGLVVCVDGTCRECAANSDCDWNEDCEGNACVRVPGRCRNTNDCPDGQICADAMCAPGCDDVHGCPRGQLCENNTCVRDPNWCDLDSDCQEGYRCDNHRCVVATPCGDREFETIYFDFDESVIRVDQEPRLEHNAECLNEFGNDDVLIAGNCDERGTDAYNLALGERRARSSKRFLERLGIAEGRMDVISYGESRPVCRQANESCWRQNRRTDFSWQ